MLFADEGPRSILVSDNAKIYHSAKLTEMCFNAGILLTYLPSYFCDYNPIKILFTVLKRYIKKNEVLIDGYTKWGFELFLRYTVKTQNQRENSGVLF